MITEIRIHFEGHALLKPGFSQFFDRLRHRAKASRCNFVLIAGGSRGAACRDFAIAGRAHPRALNVLLIDSEGPDTGDLSESLCRERAWPGSHGDSIFWMVEMMESWFHADREALERFYGPTFRMTALKRNPKVEEISKADLQSGLHEATKHTAKGDYLDHKTSHGPKLLSLISPDKVQKAAPNCRRLFTAVLAELDSPG